MALKMPIGLRMTGVAQAHKVVSGVGLFRCSELSEWPTWPWSELETMLVPLRDAEAYRDAGWDVRPLRGNGAAYSVMASRVVA